jgi:KaiC/GvpD/RAD55 family RecA-like ATPase
MEDIVPQGFALVKEPISLRAENGNLDMKGKRLDPLETEEFRLVLRPLAKGTFPMKPKIVYLDEVGHEMVCEPEPKTISVSEVILPGRVTTGYEDLDDMLLGGIPQGYAVILNSPSFDERDLLVRRFLETGARRGEVAFFVTIDASSIKALAEECKTNFYLFLCNRQIDEFVKSLPNAFMLKGVENLTEISIALASAFRRIVAAPTVSKRACIEIISDVLLQHHALSVRRWLAALIPEFRSRSFTTLAVMNSQMHPSQEVQAILDVFDGEINIFERETKRGLQKFLKISRMHDQRYLESELRLKRKG